MRNHIPSSIRDYLSYNPDTGQFFWLKRVHTRMKAGDEACSTNADGYRYITFNGKRHKASRLAWWFVHNEVPNVIDHINHDRGDDRISNLRNVTYSQNRMNLTGNKYGIV